MMTVDFLIGAIRASRDLHPQVKTELEEILFRAEPVKPVEVDAVAVTACYGFDCECGTPLLHEQPYCAGCGKPVDWT